MLLFSDLQMRVMDPTGQIFVNIETKTMKKVFEILNYQGGLDEWLEFNIPQERYEFPTLFLNSNIIFFSINYIGKPLMIEVEKKGDDWECTDAAEVNWKIYGNYLAEAVRIKCFLSG